MLCTWSRKGRLENTGKFLAHLTAMKSRRADVSWMPSRLQGDAGNSGSLPVTSMFSSAMKEEVGTLGPALWRPGARTHAHRPPTYHPLVPA